MAVLLTGLGLFIYDSFRAELDRSLNRSLRSRAADVRALNAQADTGLADSRQVLTDARNAGFAQVLRPDGTVLDATPAVAKLHLLTTTERLAGSRGVLLIDRTSFPGGPVRLLISPTSSQDHRPVLVVVGTSLRERRAALRELSAVLLLGGPVALLFASLLGYAVASLSLRSVELLRRRARVLSVTQPGQRLPVPAGNDELRRLAVTLNQMLERNEVAFERERRFVADASHELRTPLAVLKAELEVALAGDGSARELRAALTSAEGEADHVIRLAQDLLVLAQSDHGALPLDRTEVSVTAAFERIARRFAVHTPEEHREIAIAGSHGMLILADAAQLEQAVSNLAENSLRHGRGRVTLRAVGRKDTVELHVEDEGPGFPDGFLPMAFERFTRADRGRSSEGTGLGLAISRSIARRHGGDVHAVNRPGGGADVWLELPLSTHTQQSWSDPGERASDHGSVSSEGVQASTAAHLR